MAVDPIYIETEEEIPGVIERIRHAGTPEVPLVLPTRSRFGRSRFNFQLLKQYASRSGKRITIISADPAVQRMARENGLPAVGAVDQYGPWTGSTVMPDLTVLPAGLTPPEPPPAPVPLPVPAERPGAGVAAPLAAAAAASTAAAPAAAFVPAGGGAPAGWAGAGASTASPRRAGRGGPRITVERFAPQIAEFRPARAVLYTGAALILIAGLIGALVFVPSAKVTLVAQATPFTADANVVAQPGKGPVGVRAVDTTKSMTANLKSTGVQDIPAVPATGTASFDASRCVFPTGPLPPSQSLVMYAGTRLLGAGGAAYALAGKVVLSPPDWANSGTITAVQAGASGNLSPSSFTFQNPGTYSSCTDVVTRQPTTGGTDDQKKTVVSQADLDQARSSMLQQLQQQIEGDLGKETQGGEKLLPQIQYATPDFSADHKLNDNVPSFNATMKLAAEGDFYHPAEVMAAFTRILEGKVPAGRQLAGQVTPEYTITPAGGGQLTFAGKASGYVAPKIDLADVTRRVQGKTLGQAESNLRRLPIQSLTIKEYPFRLPFMPLVGSRINVEYQIVSGLPGVQPSNPPAG